MIKIEEEMRIGTKFLTDNLDLISEIQIYWNGPFQG